MKVCGGCDTNKPKSDFYKDIKMKDGLYTQCKVCKNKQNKKYRDTPNGKIISRKSLYKYNTSSKGKEIKRNSELKRKYNITSEEYTRILKDQGGVCAICGSSTPGGPGKFHVDHDHDTGKVRGLLCNNCNLGMGYYKDSIGVHLSAVQYLRKVIIEHGRDG